MATWELNIEIRHELRQYHTTYNDVNYLEQHDVLNTASHDPWHTMYYTRWDMNNQLLHRDTERGAYCARII